MRALAVAGVAAAALLGGGRTSGPTWTMHDLGTLGGAFGRASEATAINDRGEVIGWSMGRSQQRAFLWRNGRMVRLPDFGGWTTATAINDAGDIAGDGEGPGRARGDAILWRNGRLVDLGPGRATAIDDRGDVAGTRRLSNGDEHAFLWSNGTMHDLGTLGGRESQAVAINDSAQVVGTSTTAAGGTHAFLWSNGTMRDLGSLPGEDSAAAAIDAVGDVVGYAHPSIYDPDHALLWRDGTMHDLGSFGSKVKQAVAISPNGTVLVSTFRPDMHAYLWQAGHATELWPRYTAVHGMNAAGWVVGTALFLKKGPQVPFVWRRGTMTALPVPTGYGPPTSAAYAINAHGWIVGRSYGPHGDRAVLWTPSR